MDLRNRSIRFTICFDYASLLDPASRRALRDTKSPIDVIATFMRVIITRCNRKYSKARAFCDPRRGGSMREGAIAAGLLGGEAYEFSAASLDRAPIRDRATLRRR